MAKAFTESVTLNMVMKTESISFPSNTEGLDAITDVLVRNFGQTYENVYTYCLVDTAEYKDNELSCKWLVCMSEKESGNVRVGCGQYNWFFDGDNNARANKLAITIEQMLVLTPDLSSQVMNWVNTLSYPWCNTKKILETMPDIEPLSIVRKEIT